MEKVIYLQAAKSASFPAFPILAACSAATPSIAITHRASITPIHDARRQECLKEKRRKGRTGRQEDGENKSRSKAEKGEEAKDAEAKGSTKEKGEYFDRFL